MVNLALIMPPAGSTENSVIKLLHDFAKGRPHWNRLFQKICLQKPDIDFQGYPNGLVRLGEASRSLGFVKTRILNYLVSDNLDELFEYGPDIVGITVSAGAQMIWIDELIYKLKSMEKAPVIVLGGPHVTALSGQTLETLDVDYLILGEGDIVFCQLLSHLHDKGNALPQKGVATKGIIQAPAFIEDLKVLPILRHDLLDLSAFKTITVESSRGCGHGCSFCFSNIASCFNQWRPFPIENVIEELKMIATRIDRKKQYVDFIDLNFTMNHTHTRKLLNTIIESKLGLKLCISSTIDIDNTFLDLFKKAGVIQISFGIETAETFDLKKSTSVKHIRSIFCRCHELGITPQANLMFLNPKETRGQLWATFRLARLLARDSYRSNVKGTRPKILLLPHLFRPFAGTPICEESSMTGWSMPQSFREWGVLYEKIANGKLAFFNQTKNVRKIDLYLLLFRLSLLAFRYHLLRRLIALFS